MLEEVSVDCDADLGPKRHFDLAKTKEVGRYDGRQRNIL
jgi:hypothetical protein